MTSRRLDVVLRSATGVKKVHAMTSRTAAYAVAWIEPSFRVPSPMRHGRNPEWDTTISIALDERSAGKCLHIELQGQGPSLVSTTRIGFVTTDMTDLLLRGAHGAAVRAPFHDHPVTRRSGRQQGILNFELCLQGTSASASVHETIDLGYGTRCPE